MYLLVFWLEATNVVNQVIKYLMMHVLKVIGRFTLVKTVSLQTRKYRMSLVTSCIRSHLICPLSCEILKIFPYVLFVLRCKDSFYPPPNTQAHTQRWHHCFGLYKQSRKASLLCLSRLNSYISAVSQNQHAAVLQPANPAHAGKFIGWLPSLWKT